jgi:hypothetical protein
MLHLCATHILNVVGLVVRAPTSRGGVPLRRVPLKRVALQRVDCTSCYMNIGSPDRFDQVQIIYAAGAISKVHIAVQRCITDFCCHRYH